MFLLAICRRLKKETEITSGDAEQLYKVVCEEYNQSPKGHTTLWKYIKDLENKDFYLVNMVQCPKEGKNTIIIDA